MATALGQLPGAPHLVETLTNPPSAAELHAVLDIAVQTDYAPPELELVHRFGHGLTRAEAEALQGAKTALILNFAHPASASPVALRTALILAQQVARDTGGLLWDEETREIFTPDEWQKRRLDAWTGATPDVSKHIVIHAYQGDRQARAITLGMAEFGLPDVVVDDFSWAENRPVGNLINIFSQAMLEGVAVTTPGELDLDLRSITNPAVREAQLGTLKPNAQAVAKLTLLQGKWEDGDPRNRLVELGFDRYPGPDRYARLEALVSALFGAEDSVARVRHTDELLAASRAAKAKLPALRDAFNKGLEPGEYIEVKAPFKTPDGGSEWMWVEVTRWAGTDIDGLLKNEPEQVPTLHGGQMVKVSQDDIFDYIHRDAAGHQEGNETGKIIAAQQGER